MPIALEGLLAGLAHVAQGPDHLAGVAPLVPQAGRGTGVRRRAALVGAQWGLGHGLGVLMLGAALQWALDLAQVEAASGWAERLVGVVLIVLGVRALGTARRLARELERARGETRCEQRAHGAALRGASSASRAAVGMGLLHGLAGAGHFWAVLPTVAMGRGDALVYLVVYLGASVAAMVGFGLALGALVRRSGPRALPRLVGVLGAVTLVVGGYWSWSAWS